MSTEPPRLALWILTIATDRSIRSELIGDLHEEFTLRSQQSVSRANDWYWGQTLSSLPKLVGSRLQSDAVRKYGIGIAVSFAAFLLVRIWDVLLAQNAAGLVASTDAVVARVFYLVVMMVGIAFAGALVARTTFCVGDSFYVNARRSLAPASLAVFSPYLFYFFLSDNPAGYYPFVWMALAVPSLIGGAHYTVSQMSKRMVQ